MRSLVSNSKNSDNSMDTKTFYEIAADAFRYLNPYEKARFIDSRIAWASNKRFAREATLRINKLKNIQSCQPILTNCVGS